jgi:hypothetical protein
VAFNTAEGWSRDASEDIANEVLDGAYDVLTRQGVAPNAIQGRPALCPSLGDSD